MIFRRKQVVMVEKRTGEDTGQTEFALKAAGLEVAVVENLERLQLTGPPPDGLNPGLAMFFVLGALVLGAVPTGLLLAERLESTQVRDARIQRLENTAARLIVTPDGEVTFRLTEEEVAQMRQVPVPMATEQNVSPAPSSSAAPPVTKPKK